MRTFGSTASTIASVVCAMSPASADGCEPKSAAARRSKSAMRLPVLGRHPGAERTALVEAAADALGERLGLQPAHRRFDERRGRAAFLHELDLLDRRKRLERLLDAVSGHVVRQVADHDAHASLPGSFPMEACRTVYPAARLPGDPKMRRSEK